MENPIPENFAAKSLRQGLTAVLFMVLGYGTILLVLYGCIQMLKRAFS